MRQGQNPKRSRGRGNNNRRNVPARHQTFDSNGPNVRIRGNAYQVHEKYLALARDASASGDRIAAENYMQHADHYFRIINVDSDDDGVGRGRHPGQRHEGHPGNGREFDDGFDFGQDVRETADAKSGNPRAKAAGGVPAQPESRGAPAANGVSETPAGLGDQPDTAAPTDRGAPSTSAPLPNGSAEPAAATPDSVQVEAPKPRRGRPRKTPAAAAAVQPEE